MLPLLHLITFTGGKSHSFLVDLYQTHVRNLLLFGFGLSMARQIFGENIICHLMKQSVTQSYADTKCFINGTMTLGDHPTVYHDYYQWIAIVLLLLALGVYWPFSIWFQFNGSYIKEISTNITDEKSCERVMEVLKSSRGCGMFWKTWTLEIVYALHLLMMGYALDRFFNHMWSKSGWSWTAIDILFPESGRCFVDYYSGGDVTIGRFTCLLPLNSVYRRVFWVLYLVALLLMCLHVVVFVHRLFLSIRLGREYVDLFWTWKIAETSAETFHAKQMLQEEWNQMYNFVPIEKYKV